MATKAKQQVVTNAETAAPTAEKKPKRVVSRRAKPKQSAKRGPVKPMKAKVAQAATAKPAPKPRAPKKQSTAAERAKIIAAADRDALTALQVQERFGVKPVTYYSWRKASKTARAKTQPALRAALGGIDIVSQIRLVLRDQIGQLLPELVRSELAVVLGGPSDRRQGRPKREL